MYFGTQILHDDYFGVNFIRFCVNFKAKLTNQYSIEYLVRWRGYSIFELNCILGELELTIIIEHPLMKNLILSVKVVKVVMLRPQF